MKVCFISPYSSRGGAELSLIELIDALQPRGFECSCIVRQHGSMVDLLAERGVEPIVVPFKPWVHARKKSILGRIGKMLPHRQIASAVRLASAIKRSGCDLVYTNSVTAGAGAMAAKIAGKPHIWHLREFGHDDYELSYDLGHTFSAFLMKWLPSTFVANSESVAAAYRKDLGQSEVNVIYNAVDFPESIDCISVREENDLWRHAGAIRCVLLGKYLRGKGQEDAVRAMLHLRKMKVDAELLLVGGTLDHAYYEQIRDLIERHDLTDRVQLLDHTDNPAPLMKSADVALMCSRREAFGRVTVEGMKLGKPVIGTRSGGTTEIIEEGVTGLLYQPGNSQELARKIAYLHRNAAQRSEIGLAARCSAYARFNLTEYGANTARVLQRATSNQDVSQTASDPELPEADIDQLSTRIVGARISGSDGASADVATVFEQATGLSTYANINRAFLATADRSQSSHNKGALSQSGSDRKAA